MLAPTTLKTTLIQDLSVFLSSAWIGQAHKWPYPLAEQGQINKKKMLNSMIILVIQSAHDGHMIAYQCVHQVFSFIISEILLKIRSEKLASLCILRC